MRKTFFFFLFSHSLFFSIFPFSCVMETFIIITYKFYFFAGFAEKKKNSRRSMIFNPD